MAYLGRVEKFYLRGTDFIIDADSFFICGGFYSCKNIKSCALVMEWFTLRVISGKEKKIRDSILYDVSLSGLEELIGDILVPSENIVEMRDGKKKIKEKVFFPGYLLVRLEMNKETKYLLENINGVISFVGPKGQPQALRPEEAQRFLSDDGSDGPLRTTEASPYVVGDNVRVTDGPFMDFSGLIQEVNHDKQKLKVFLNLQKQLLVYFLLLVKQEDQ